MKLAYLTNQYPAVSHTFIRNEICALEEQGIEIARFSIRRANENFPDAADQRELARTEFLLEQGVGALLKHTAREILARPRAFFVATSCALKMGWRSQRGVARHLVYLAEACLLRARCAERGIAHLHVHHATNPAAVARLCFALGGPTYSLTVHGPEEFDAPTRWALNEKVAGAQFVVTVSEWGRAQLQRACDEKYHTKFRVVHCGIGEAFVREAPGAVPNTPRFLWVGRLAEQKDPLTLLDAVECLHAQNVLCAVTMVGDGELRSMLETEIARRKLDARVALAGWADGEMVRTELRAARALVLSSRAENAPSVILEALAQGRAVISTDVGGVRELVQDGETGWLVPPRSPELLANALRRALETDVKCLSRMGENGRNFVLENYNLTRQAIQLRALFESTVQTFGVND